MCRGLTNFVFSVSHCTVVLSPASLFSTPLNSLPTSLEKNSLQGSTLGGVYCYGTEGEGLDQFDFFSWPHYRHRISRQIYRFTGLRYHQE